MQIQTLYINVKVFKSLFHVFKILTFKFTQHIRPLIIFLYVFNAKRFNKSCSLNYLLFFQKEQSTKKGIDTFNNDFNVIAIQS